MKILSFFILCLGLALIISCGNKAETTNEASSQSNELSVTPPTDGMTTTGTAPGGSVPHYQCPAGHVEGNADGQGKCPKCGADLVHNAAFHATQQNSGASPENAIQVNPTNQSGEGTIQLNTPTATTPTAPPPAQNAAGEFHHICPKGCAGGAGTPGNCAKCGTALVHNDKYHK